MLDESPTSAEALYQQARSLRDMGRLREAFDLFLKIARTSDGVFAEKQRRHAYSLALNCAGKLPDWGIAESTAREALDLHPSSPEYHTRLGEALLRLQRYDEAEAALVHALELRPADQEVPLLLELARARAELAPARAKIATWPVRQRSFADLKTLVRRYLLGRRRGAPIIAPESIFMTFGSCFAVNLARHLRSMGRTVHAAEIGEDVNSTFANRHLLDWVENGVTNAATAAIQDAYGPSMREQLRRQIAESDVFVITLGAAVCFFSKDTGDFAFVVSKTPTAADHLFENHVMRTTTVAENVENLHCMMDSVARMADRPPKFVLTVSPVPLGGTTERESAVIADCVSKSTLRVAADQVCAEDTGRHLVYWPSFEIVRWLSPHFGPDHAPVFGADDGNTRHVSDWLVRRIVKLFVEHHTPAQEQAAVDAQGHG